MIEKGKKVKLAYTIKIGEEYATESIQEFDYEHGKTIMVPQLEDGLTGLDVGAKKTIMITSEENQIRFDEDNIKEVDKKVLKGEQGLQIGQTVQIKNSDDGKIFEHGPDGYVFEGKIIEIKEDKIVVDFNHLWVGKNVEINIEVLNIKG